jgi:hypothetical protein
MITQVRYYGYGHRHYGYGGYYGYGGCYGYRPYGYGVARRHARRVYRRHWY